MQIKVNLKIFLFLLLFLITRQIKIYAIIMVFALIHELGHLAMGIILGFKPESISIIPTGFCIKFKTECQDYNKKIKKANLLAIKRILIAIAGPLTNIILIAYMIIFYKITGSAEILGISSELIIYANILIFIFNILPIYPLDGGRILKEITYIFSGIQNSYKITNQIANITVIILTILASIFVLQYHNIAIILIIGYLWLMLIRENKTYHTKDKILKILQKNIEKNNI